MSLSRLTNRSQGSLYTHTHVMHCQDLPTEANSAYTHTHTHTHVIIKTNQPRPRQLTHTHTHTHAHTQVIVKTIQPRPMQLNYTRAHTHAIVVKTNQPRSMQLTHTHILWHTHTHTTHTHIHRQLSRLTNQGQCSLHTHTRTHAIIKTNQTGPRQLTQTHTHTHTHTQVIVKINQPKPRQLTHTHIHRSLSRLTNRGQGSLHTHTHLHRSLSRLTNRGHMAADTHTHTTLQEHTPHYKTCALMHNKECTLIYNKGLKSLWGKTSYVDCNTTFFYGEKEGNLDCFPMEECSICRVLILDSWKNAFSANSLQNWLFHMKDHYFCYHFLEKRSENQKNVRYCVFPWGGRVYIRAFSSPRSEKGHKKFDYTCIYQSSILQVLISQNVLLLNVSFCVGALFFISYMFSQLLCKLYR